MERVDRLTKEMRTSSRFLSRTFTDRERAYCMSKANPAMYFAGTFAAKEAALKALSSLHVGRTTIAEFEILHLGNGAPRVNYIGAKAKKPVVDIRVSVSHTKEVALAVAIAVLCR